jgi:hypothetical protein
MLEKNNFRELEMPEFDQNSDIARIVYEEVCLEKKVTIKDNKIIESASKEEKSRQQLNRLYELYRIIKSDDYDHIKFKN